MKTWNPTIPLLIMRLHLRPFLTSFLHAAALLLLCADAGAATVIWTGPSTGNWSDTANWSTGSLPAANDTVNISVGNTVTYDIAGGSLPSSLTINLEGSIVTGGTVIRMNNATLNVASTGLLGGAFWDLDDADIVFQSGASATMANWENKDINNFTFVLGASGFSALTPGTFRIGNGTLAGSIANVSYTADLAAYTGSGGTITLMDFTSDATSMTDALFQTADLNVINAGSYSAGFAWNSTTKAIELTITAAVPEPARAALLLGGFCGLLLRRRRGTA